MKGDRAETCRRILAELDDGDASVFDLASSLGISEAWTIALLRTLRDETHLIDGTFRDGTYRRGAPPDGHTVDASELTRRAILAAVAHEALTAREIAERIGKSKTRVTFMLRDLRERITRQDGGKYIAVDASPAPVVLRIPLPLWAAALQ